MLADPYPHSDALLLWRWILLESLIYSARFGFALVSLFICDRIMNAAALLNSHVISLEAESRAGAAAQEVTESKFPQLHTSLPKTKAEFCWYGRWEE